jgi:hypothetical protein
LTTITGLVDVPGLGVVGFGAVGLGAVGLGVVGFGLVVGGVVVDGVVGDVVVVGGVVVDGVVVDVAVVDVVAVVVDGNAVYATEICVTVGVAVPDPVSTSWYCAYRSPCVTHDVPSRDVPELIAGQEANDDASLRSG